MKDLMTRQEVDAAFSEPSAIVFKHSTRCPISARAQGEMEQVDARGPGAPVYRVDVNEQTELSNYVGERTGIEHQSPQVIVLRDGSPVWHASRMEIHADEVAGQVGGGPGGG